MTQALAEKSWTVALRAPTAEKLEISVYDFIGEGFFGDGISAKDVLAKLSAAPKATEITLRINSSGGVVDDAKAMINLLAERKAQGAKVLAFVDGMAASSASYLTTVADHVTVASNAFVMFHQARTGRMGNSKEMADASEFLTRTDDQLADGYASASARRGKGKIKADFLASMAKGDTYLDADQAIEWGLADAKSEPLKAVACLADLNGLPGAPDAVRAAPYVALAAVDVTEDLNAVVADSGAPPPAELVVTEPPTTPAREGSVATETTLAEEPPMTVQSTSFPTTIAIALGLPAGSTESDIQASLGRLRDFEREALAISGVAVSSEAIGTLRGFKAKADAHDKMALELSAVKAERDKQNFETLIANGKSDGKLVTVTVKHYEDKFAVAVANGRGSEFVDEMRGFLSVAPRVLPQPARQVAASVSGSGPGLWNGKTYAELKPMEKDRLSREDPELFAHMRRDHQQSVA